MVVVWRGSREFIRFEEAERKPNQDYSAIDGVVHRGLHGSRRGQDIEAAPDDTVTSPYHGPPEPFPLRAALNMR